jgi:hypothetical protein
MSGIGKRFRFHGRFKTKADAKRKEKSVYGFIRKVTVKRVPYYLVMTRKD